MLKEQLEFLNSKEVQWKSKEGRAPIKGKGKYTKGKGKALGQTLGNKVGGWLGGAAENLLHSIIGVGDYTEIEPTVPTTNNTIMGVGTAAAQIPEMHRSKEVTRINHREYICDINMHTSVATGGLKTFLLYPGNPKVFPWMAQIAPNFQQWKLLGAVFEYRSLTSNATAQTTPGMGSLTFVLRYDVTSLPVANKMDASNTMYAISGKPSESMMLPVECDPTETPNQPLYVTTSQSPNVPQLYYFAALDVLSQGAPAAYDSAGELWITYDILLLKPIARITGSSMQMVHIPINGNPGALALATNGVIFDSIGVTVNLSAGTIVLDPQTQPGTQFILTQQYYSQGAETAFVVTSAGISGGLVRQYALSSQGGAAFQDQYYQGYPMNQTFSSSNVGVSSGMSAFAYDGTGSTASPPTITLTAGACAHPYGGDIYLTIVNPALYAPQTNALT